MIYLNNYLSTMFQISDVLIDKEEVAMSLCFNIQTPETPSDEDCEIREEQISVSKTQIRTVLSKAAEVLYIQGISCCRFRNAQYKLYSYPGDCREKDLFELNISCTEGSALYRFERKLSCRWTGSRTSFPGENPIQNPYPILRKNKRCFWIWLHTAKTPVNQRFWQLPRRKKDRSTETYGTKPRRKAL